jgi:CHAD domain-containing protein
MYRNQKGARAVAAGKWISDLKATTPVADAARHVLTVRLEVVRDYLPLALHESDNDPEHVHQLRVATRRARAALDILTCCLPAKVYKSARKHLRNIRRVAGEARDWDVFLSSLTEFSRAHPGKRKPGLDGLVGYAVARRQAAQEQLKATGQHYPFAFDRFLAETVAAVHEPLQPNLHMLLDLARPLLTAFLKQLEEAVSRNLEDYEQLHWVRILAKRLRYAMEVFADCFAPAFREQIYPAVEQMQEILGAANDSYVACGKLKAIATRLQALVPLEWKRYRPGLDALLEYHRKRLPEEREHFQDWRARWCQSGGEAAFFALLKNPDDCSVAVDPLQLAATTVSVSSDRLHDPQPASKAES